MLYLFNCEKLIAAVWAVSNAANVNLKWTKVTSGVQGFLRPRRTWRWTGSRGRRHPGLTVEKLRHGFGNKIRKVLRSHEGEKVFLFA